MARGGARPGSGRPKGSRNVTTIERIEAIKAEGIMPLDYLLGVMRDMNADEAKRIDAAKAAAPYCHPKLQPVDKDGNNEQVVAVQVMTGVPRDDTNS